MVFIAEKKGRYLTQLYCKALTTTETQTQKHHQKFVYTSIADRLMTVCSSEDCHSAGMEKVVYGIQTFPLTTKAE